MRHLYTLALCLAISASFSASAASTSVDDLKKDVEKLRRELADRQVSGSPITQAVAIVDNRYGPNAPVATKMGKLAIGGAFQIWYQAIQNDQKDYIGGQNQTFDNDTFRLRRIVLRFSMDYTENISSLVLLDSATPPRSYASYPQNQGLTFTKSRSPADVQTGGYFPNAVLLLDAKINYHGVIPHHDFTIGQFKRRMGEEGSRPSDFLDFVDRSMIGQIAHNSYDIGIEAHGTWWDDKIQYWGGVQNGTATILTIPRFNRSDDNDAKNVFGALQIRPFWKQEKWGGLELGYSVMGGTGGESAAKDFGADAVNGLNRPRTAQVVQYWWLGYNAGGPARGLWLRSEFASFKDRLGAKAVVSDDVAVVSPEPFNIHGWYAALGYRLDSSRFCDRLPAWAKPLEFTFRHEEFQNLFYADLETPDRYADVFPTTVNTAGVNYNFKGHNAKIMLNYNFVDETNPKGGRVTRDVHNDQLAVQFQVSF